MLSPVEFERQQILKAEGVCETRGYSKVIAIRPDGSLDRTIDLPISIPSSLAFGGADLDRLFITSIDPSTMPAHFNCGPEPDGGRLFVIDGLGVKGLPDPLFPAKHWGLLLTVDRNPWYPSPSRALSNGAFVYIDWSHGRSQHLRVSDTIPSPDHFQYSKQSLHI